MCFDRPKSEIAWDSWLFNDVRNGLYEHLSTREFCSVRTPHLLTFGQKRQSVDDPKHSLEPFTRNEITFFQTIYCNGFITTFHDEIHSQPRTQQLAKTVFWDAHCIIFIDYLEKRQRIYNENCIALFVRLNDAILRTYWVKFYIYVYKYMYTYMCMQYMKIMLQAKYHWTWTHINYELNSFGLLCKFSFRNARNSFRLHFNTNCKKLVYVSYATNWPESYMHICVNCCIILVLRRWKKKFS